MNVLPDAEQLKLDDAMWERACLAAQDHRVDDKDLLNAQRGSPRLDDGTVCTSSRS